MHHNQALSILQAAVKAASMTAAKQLLLLLLQVSKRENQESVKKLLPRELRVCVCVSVWLQKGEERMYEDVCVCMCVCVCVCVFSSYNLKKHVFQLKIKKYKIRYQNNLSHENIFLQIDLIVFSPLSLSLVF